MGYTVALFGEAEKGNFFQGYYCKSLADLSDSVGEPPSSESQGLYFAIQALLFQYQVLFFRVHEEGFSVNDYLKGLTLLERAENLPSLSALCMPGVGNSEIIQATTPICESHNSFLIITEKDFYDYFTHYKR